MDEQNKQTQAYKGLSVATKKDNSEDCNKETLSKTLLCSSGGNGGNRGSKSHQGWERVRRLWGSLHHLESLDRSGRIPAPEV